MLLLLLACGEAEEASTPAPGTPAPTSAAEPAPAAPALERSPPLQALVATSGAGVDAVFDGQARTGWSPLGGSSSEGLLMRLDKPHDVGIEGMELVLCPDSAATSVVVYVNGSKVGQFYELGPGEGDELRFQPASTRSIFLKIHRPQGKVCIAEVGLLIDGDTHTPEPPRSEPGKLTVSSQLEPADAYHPDYLFDSREDFGWVEGAKGHGVGETLTIDFESPQTLTGLDIWNGYQRSDDHFAKNSRVQTMKLTVDGQEQQDPLRLLDSDGKQRRLFQFPIEVKQQLKLEITEVYPGSKYQDLVISELRFVDERGSFGLAVDLDSRARALKKQVAGSPLEAVVDRSFASVCDGPYIGGRELKLRSNNSFVWYDQSEDLEEVFDGAWVPEGEAGVKLYGRIHRIQTVYVAYGQGATSDTTRIGGGTVTVTRAADLAQSDWDERIDQLQKGAAELRFECAPTHAEAVERGLVLVEGKPFVDLLYPVGG